MGWTGQAAQWSEEKGGENQAPMANKHIHRLLFPEGSINQDFFFLLLANSSSLG